ncbi:MAG TPA: arsinothricin resistance N-acetyltransferase ArsN1 family B [Thermoanaerobaculia bacterium]|nr:arsinothricin resistance N-acetyltransferase ArsN1 family B [Thermoanaerobaculia bacterium]
MSATIRLATPDDAPGVLAIYEPVVVETATSFEEVAPTLEEMAKRIADTLETYPWLICDCDGAVAGYAYATRFRARAAYRWAVETSVYIHPDYQRVGVGRALYRSLFALLALQGYVTAYAGIAVPNYGSTGLHEAVGFEPIGVYWNVGYKLGAWRNVGWWGRELRELPARPEEPLPLAAARALAGWETALAAGAHELRI